MYYQALVEDLSPEIYKTTITAVEKLRGYRCFIYRRLNAVMDGNVSAFGNRGNVVRYEEKPYIVGKYVIQGLAGFYMKADRTLDTYNGSEFKLWFHHEIPLERDSFVIVDRGKRGVDTVGDGAENIFDYKGSDYDIKSVLKRDDLQGFLVTDIKNKQGWGTEILQFAKLVPKPIPMLEGVR